MNVEEHLDFLDPLDIRIKGHRIGIDDVLYFYLKGYQREAIQERYPSLGLAQIDAAIAYYDCHREEMDDYLRAHAAWTERRRQELSGDPPPVVQRIRAKLQAQGSK